MTQPDNAPAAAQIPVGACGRPRFDYRLRMHLDSADAVSKPHPCDLCRRDCPNRTADSEIANGAVSAVNHSGKQ